MVLLFLPYIVQLVLIVHAIRNGKNPSWIWLLLMVPYVGGGAYFFLEILPDLRRGRIIRMDDVVGLVDKNLSIRRLKEEIALSDTPANRIALADEYFRLGDFAQAEKGYLAELKGLYRDDPTLQLKVARCAFELEDYPTAQDHFTRSLASRPTTSTEILAMAAYCRWELARDAEALAALENLFAVNKTSDSALHLCRAYGKLQNPEGIRSVIGTCELQLSRLQGTARRAAKDRIQRMRALLTKP